jgi:hypothetical protein
VATLAAAPEPIEGDERGDGREQGEQVFGIHAGAARAGGHMPRSSWRATVAAAAAASADSGADSDSGARAGPDDGRRRRALAFWIPELRQRV